MGDALEEQRQVGVDGKEPYEREDGETQRDDDLWLLEQCQACPQANGGWRRHHRKEEQDPTRGKSAQESHQDKGHPPAKERAHQGPDRHAQHRRQRDTCEDQCQRSSTFFCRNECCRDC
jgi:hypothetical protein